LAVDLAHDLRTDLEAVVGAQGLIAESDELLVYECDGYTIAKSAPDAVIFPESTEQAAQVMRVLQKHGIPFVPRGAGTSLAGGCLPVGGGVFVSTARMKRILQLDPRNRYAHVEAGVVNLHVSQAVKSCDLHYAPDPSSQMACTIGGNVATNSGGPHTLKYGVTVNHTLGATLVLADGRIVKVGGVTQDAPGLDLTGVIVGSEGTFGLVTEVIVRLTRNPTAYRTLLGVFETVDEATQTVSDIIAAGIVPGALEMMDKLIVNAVEDAYHFGFPRDAEAVLIVELDGLEAGIDRLANRVTEICNKNRAREVRRADTEEQRLAVWKCRKRAFGAIGRISPSYCTQDGVVPRTKLPEILKFIRACAKQYDITIANVFHAGDGNIHPILLFDERDGDQVKRVLEASNDILTECVRLGGSVTGEHGIGVEKLDHIKLMFTEADLNAQRKLREVFDPELRANPNKVYATGAACVEVLRPMRRAAV
jgi:glycolate dehydrogenase FAD-linked subunit